jgi:hypothetical protein
VRAAAGPVHLVLHLGGEDATLALPLPSGRYAVALDSADGRWRGPGSSVPKTFPSKGEVRMHVHPRQALVIRREAPR